MGTMMGGGHVERKQRKHLLLLICDPIEKRGGCYFKNMCLLEATRISSDSVNRSHREQADIGVNGSQGSPAVTTQSTETTTHISSVGSPPQRVFSEDTHSLERQVAEHRRTRETSGDTFGTPQNSRRGFAEVFRRLRPKADEKPRTPRSSPRTNNDVAASRHRHNTNRSNQDWGVSSRETVPLVVSGSDCGYKLEGPKPPPPPPLVPESTAVYELVSEDEKEDICPTCLEPYTEENPKITAKCGHTFHLSCIYEWLERSRYCPVCANIMEFEENNI
ncbi:zinc finger (C3HC4-type RING finger) family protein [Galdieria sulphuraria]|uniref:RING-type E3 ubiquitin transferase n=1 Tax=Galdieria sulphuraria TaxID=130081 RepID=M2WVX4_GALSU|nr:zinc finger (C3HC4-type RING finger) family protein [Galdieria sulphuraria]EME28145.1 zinc finger (C3HC4-type RING finger) family protein [Galdieria sulphuraria]|eukprot:XP_005704665.1 zinc finger (C3HC4-type RING finger) family protein [Galdieria sulphuraria]